MRSSDIDKQRNRNRARPNRLRPVWETLEERRLLAVDFGVNLLQNPGAEDGLNGWFAPSSLTQAKAYGLSDTPSTVNGPMVGGQFTGGGHLFYGGDADTSGSTTTSCSLCSLTQDVVLDGIDSQIDQGIVYADLSGWLGGWLGQNDRTTLRVTWLDNNGSDVAPSNSISPVTNADRGNITSVLYREDRFPVPTGAREARITLRFNRSEGDDNDATADNISFSLSVGEEHGVVGDPECPISASGSSSALNLLDSIGGSSGNSFGNTRCGSLSIPFSTNSGETIYVDSGALVIDTSVSIEGSLTMSALPGLDSMLVSQGDISSATLSPGSLLINIPSDGSLGLIQNSTSFGTVFASGSTIDRVQVSMFDGTAVFNDGATPLNDAHIIVAVEAFAMGKGFAPSALNANGAYFVGGTLLTDDGPDAHTSGNLTLTSTASLRVTLDDGTITGDVTDITTANGTVVIDSATLEFVDNVGRLPGRVVEVITNDGSDPIDGTFSGLPEGAAFDVNGDRYHISYQGGTGNDVIVRRNRPPVAVENGSTLEDTLLDDSVQIGDPDGDTVTATLVSGPNHAEAFSFNADGTFTYQPNLHYSGSDSFSFQVDDGDLTASFIHTIDVVPVADAPVLTDSGSIVGDEGEWIPLGLSTSLVDTDGSEQLQPLLVEGVPAGVVLSDGTDNGDGTWTVPAADVASLEIESPDNQSFTLTLTSTSEELANNDTASTTITLDVEVNNVAPVLTVSDRIAGSELLRDISDVVTFNDPGYVNADAGTDELFTYTIDWGDGTPLDSGSATVDAVGSLPTGSSDSPLTEGSFDGSHTYAEDGRYTVTVTVTDDDAATTTETFEVWVMIRLLDVTYTEGQVQLEFTDPIDPTHATNETIRVMGSQSGLLNDTATTPQVAGELVTISFLHEGFAGEELTVILPADRDELNRSGVWSTDDSPIYQPEIDTYRVPATGGTGKWIVTEVIDTVSDLGRQETPAFAADINRDGLLDTLWPGGTTTRQDGGLGWDVTPSDNLLVDDLLAADTDGDGTLERIDIDDPDSVGVHIADFDLDGELEELVVGRFGNWTLDDFERIGVDENAFGTSSLPYVFSSGIELYPADFDGDGDIDVFVHTYRFRSADGYIWLNPIRNPSPTGETILPFDLDNSTAQIAVEDVNGDGMADVVAFGDASGSDITAFLSNGPGGLSTSLTTNELGVLQGSPDPHPMVIDFDGDSDLDIVFEDGDLRFLENDGVGGFSLLPESSGFVFHIVAGDFNGDGAIDLMARDTSLGGHAILLNATGGNSVSVGDMMKIRPNTQNYGGYFGTVFDSDGQTLIAAQPNEGSTTDATLSFFERGADEHWTETQTISIPLPDGVSNLLEPLKVVIDGERAGIYYNYYDGGYQRLLKFYAKQSDGSWSEETQLEVTSDGSFAYANQFDLSGDVAVIEAFDERILTYVRDANGVWAQDESKTIDLGFSLSNGQVELEGNQLFVGLPHETTTVDGTDYGGKIQAYEMGSNSWELRSELLSSFPADGSNQDLFGERFAYDNGWLAATGGPWQDRVELFQTADIVNWNQVQTIDRDQWTDDGFRTRFGKDLSLENGTLAIGSPLDDQAATNGGAVHLYRLDQTGTWQFEAKLIAPDVAADDEFHTVDVNGDLVLVGSNDDGIPVSNGLRTDAGAIYVFRLPNVALTANPDMATTDESTGLSIDVLANDTAPDTGDPTTFSLDSIDDVTVTGLEGVTSLPAGVISISGTEILFTPGDTFQQLTTGLEAEVVVAYTMSDDEGLTSSSTLTLTVTGVNDVPVAEDLSINAMEDGAAVSEAFVGGDDDHLAGHLVFATSFTTSLSSSTSFPPSVPNFGGITNASYVVTFAAAQADFGGADYLNVPDWDFNEVIYTAVLSDSTTNAQTNVNFQGPIINTNGERLADDSTEFFSGTLQNPIGYDENGLLIADSNKSLWSGIDAGGGVEPDTCGNWDLNWDLTGSVVTDTGSTDTVNWLTGVTTSCSAGSARLLGASPLMDLSALASPSFSYALVSQPSEGSVTNVGDGTFAFDPGTDFQDLAAGETRDVTFQYTVTDELGSTSPPATVTVTVTGVADIESTEIVGRHIFYNDSSFDPDPDGAGPETGANANASDDGAISEKVALRPGDTASFVNYTSYSKGINGIMVDLANAADVGALSLSDFEFRTGNTPSPGGWSLAPAPTDFEVRAGEGEDGSDRVTIVWANNVIENEWLQVTVKATDQTGLVLPDVHYWGNQVAETGNVVGSTAVSSQDIDFVANNTTGFVPAEITNPYDFNRDTKVSATDIDIVANNTTGFFSLVLLDAPPQGAPTAAAAFTLLATGVPTFAAAQEPGSPIDGDTNRDGIVDFQDFLTLASAFGRQDTDWSQGDFNDDGQTDFYDFLALAGSFGQSEPPSESLLDTDDQPLLAGKLSAEVVDALFQ